MTELLRERSSEHMETKAKQLLRDQFDSWPLWIVVDVGERENTAALVETSGDRNRGLAAAAPISATVCAEVPEADLGLASGEFNMSAVERDDKLGSQSVPLGGIFEQGLPLHSSLASAVPILAFSK